MSLVTMKRDQCGKTLAPIEQNRNRTRHLRVSLTLRTCACWWFPASEVDRGVLRVCDLFDATKSLVRSTLCSSIRKIGALHN